MGTRAHVGVRYHYNIINREISIRKYFSLIITIPQEDMCAVLVEIISSLFFGINSVSLCNNNE